jgi:TadE-like protein
MNSNLLDCSAKTEHGLLGQLLGRKVVRRHGSASGPQRAVPKLGSSGVVAVEFVVVMVPLFLVLFCFVQLSYLYQAHMLVRHAAITGARAAAVILKKGNNNPYASGNASEVTSAVKRATGQFGKKNIITIVSVDSNDRSSDADPFGMVTVKVRAMIKCHVPLGGRIACFPLGRKLVTIEASYPKQGANYLEEKEEKK